MEDEEKRLTIRIPADLHAKLTKRAENNRRSLNNEMIALLERFVDSEEVGYKNGIVYRQHEREEYSQVAETPPKRETKSGTRTG